MCASSGQNLAEQAHRYAALAALNQYVGGDKNGKVVYIVATPQKWCAVEDESPAANARAILCDHMPTDATR